MKLSNEEILKIAMYQSSIDENCRLEDFCCTENVIAYSKKNNLARKYLKLPHIWMLDMNNGLDIFISSFFLI